MKYTYRVHWSPEDQQYVGTVAEFPSLSWLADSKLSALDGIIALVNDVLADMRTESAAINENPAEQAESAQILAEMTERRYRVAEPGELGEELPIRKVADNRISHHGECWINSSTSATQKRSECVPVSVSSRMSTSSSIR